MKVLVLFSLIFLVFSTGDAGAGQPADGGARWETRAFNDALGKGTLKVRIIEEVDLPKHFGAHSVAVLNPANDQSAIAQCSQAISRVIEEADVGIVVGELRQGQRVHWYVYASSFEALDGAFESIQEKCPLLWGNHHDREWDQYGHLREGF